MKRVKISLFLVFLFLFSQLWFLLSLYPISFVYATPDPVGTTEFVCKIRSSGGDYSTLSGWESAIQCDLTAATTKVFGHGGINGSIPDNSTVTGKASGVTGTCKHATSTQILITGITGTFQSGEQVYKTLDVNYVVISDAGDSAIAVAECYNDWPNGLEEECDLDGWTTSSTNYVKIYAPEGQRHDGRAKDSAGNYTGFTLKVPSGSWNRVISVREEYTRIDGIVIDGGPGREGCAGIRIRGDIDRNGKYSRIEHCIVFNFDSSGSMGFQDSTTRNTYVSNNLAYDCETGFLLRNWKDGYYYNNDAVNCTTGFKISERSEDLYLKNCLAAGCTTDFSFADATGNLTYCASSDATADDHGGTGNRVNQSFTFVDEANNDFHLASTDAGARNYGTDLSSVDYPITDDIDFETRPGENVWDIGADEYIDIYPPSYSNVGTNNTAAGEPTLFHSKWLDDAGLSGYIFSTNNTGTWLNKTWEPLTGTLAWVNVTETLNSTAYIPIGYRFYCNDTSNNWNDTGIYTLTTRKAVTRQLSQTISISDLTKRLAALSRTLTESITASDVPSRLSQLLRTMQESLPLFDVLNSLKELFIPPPPPGPPLPTPPTPIQRFFIELYETVSIEDVPSRLSQLLRGLSEGISPSDVLNRRILIPVQRFFIELSETISISEALNRLRILQRELTQTINLSDIPSRWTNLFREISQPIPLSDMASGLRGSLPAEAGVEPIFILFIPGLVAGGLFFLILYMRRKKRVCRNCAYFKVRRGKPYCPVVKQRVSENYTCGRFKPKQT